MLIQLVQQIAGALPLPLPLAQSWPTPKAQLEVSVKDNLTL